MTLLQRIAGISIIFSILIATTTRYNKKATTPQDNLRVGVIIGYEPFAILTSEGVLTGFDIEVAQAIGKKLNKNIVFQDMSLAALLIALEQNKIDMVLTSLSITPERQQAYTMVHYYGQPTREFPLAFWNPGQKSLPALKTIADLVQYTTDPIAVEPGSAQEKLLRTYTQITTKSLNSIQEIVLDLKYKKSYAALLDPEIIPTLQRQNKEIQTLLIAIPDEYQSQGAGIAINKNNTALQKEISKAITLLKQDGTIAKLEAQWLEEQA